MDFHIKRFGKAFVVEDSAGTRHSGSLSFEAATTRRDTLESAERRAHARIAPGSSQSSLYRQIDNDPVLRQAADAIKKLKKGLRQYKSSTMSSYLRAMQQMGSEPILVKESLRDSARRAAARVAVAAKRKKRGIPTRDQVIALTHTGMRQVDIAAKLGISARQVRKHQRDL
jgi:hypothetical protein